MNLVITGGGTGGHIFAGVAIAQEFLKQSKANEVLFVGSEFGLETRLIPKAGLKLETLRLGKLVGQSIFTRLQTLFQIPVAIVRSIRILQEYKADIVIGVGGYAAGPCIIAARILRIPIGVLEQNAVMGFTNKISARVATQVFLSFDKVPVGVRPEKCVVTGNPTRNELTPSATKAVKPFIVFAFGGSQGARGINRILTAAAKNLLPYKNEIQIIHQTGEREYEGVVKAYQEIGYPAEVYKFIDQMQGMYSKASLVVCRAGSSTISELGATQNAAIFIPFPMAAANHQVFNANQVKQAGGAEVLLERDAFSDQGAEIAKMILDLMNDPKRLEQMRKNIASFHRPDAANRIVEIMKIHALKN